MSQSPNNHHLQCETSLAVAAGYGRLDEARKLIAQGVDLEQVNEEGFTPLMMAANYGHTDLVSTLLAAGASPDTLTSNGSAALTLAIWARSPACVAALLEGGANPNLRARQGHLPIDMAVIGGEVGLVRLLLVAGADPDARNYMGRTPLQESSRLGYSAIARVLLEHGASPILRSRDGLKWTPWDFAKQAGHGSVLQELSRAGVVPPPRRSIQPRCNAIRVGIARFVNTQLLQRCEARVLDGVCVRVYPDRHLEALFHRVSEALEIIGAYDPRVLARMRRTGITIWLPGTEVGREEGSYDDTVRTCSISTRFALSPQVTPAAIAGTLVHELVHDRTWTPLYRSDAFVRARIERICNEAQRDFLRKVPGTAELVRTSDERGRLDPVVWTARARTREQVVVLFRYLFRRHTGPNAGSLT